ncbi:hypothetical protein N8D56_17875 [Devosia sp. A8/3-2]|nr:hypothetical protein N8D56_17875 [Devosia sp. A8/3-2]
MSDAAIHPTAIVGQHARIGKGVKIGPYCIVGDKVILHDNVELVSHVVIDGNTEVGASSRIFPFASVGLEPQDRKYHGENSRPVIGERCVIRESATLNPGTDGGGMLTKIGNDCLIMASAHVAHDAIIGDNVVMANYVGIAGHCQSWRQRHFRGCLRCAPVHPDWVACLYRRPFHDRWRRDPLWHGRGQSGIAYGPQSRWSQAA